GFIPPCHIRNDGSPPLNYGHAGVKGVMVMHTGTLRLLVLVTLCAALCACGEDDAPADDRESAPQRALERETPSVTSSRDEADTVAMQEIEIALGPVFLVPTPQPVPTNTTASYDDVEVASFVAPLGT